MRTKQRSSQCRVPRASLLIALTTIILFSCSQESLAQQWTTNGNDISNTNTGNVGLGTGGTAPGYKLDVLSSINMIARFGSSAGTNTQVLIDAPSGYNSNLTLQHGGVSKWYLGNRASDNRFSFAEATGSVELLAILPNGNVGIGTTGPNYRLDVQGGRVNASAGLCIAGDCKTNWSQVGGGAVNSVFGRTGAVVPQAGDYTWAQINKTTSSLADIAIRNAGDLSSGTLPDARFPTTLPAVSGANLMALNASSLATGTVPITRLGSGTADSTKFLRGDNTWAVPSGSSQWTTSGTIISYNSGNVGVGTASPTEKLEVIGNIKVSGNINAKYQDVAEWVDSSQELVAGTVVVLDSSRSNHVIAATQPYDSRIAGVISLQPGLTLGEEAEGRVLVATTGRVRVKVDATEGPIQIGDLLVTSNREGFAMKSLPVDVGGVRIHQPGTLIGKALEPLAKGTGEILVLLSLQ